MKMHLWRVQWEHVHKVTHAMTITAYFRVRHYLKTGTKACLSLDHGLSVDGVMGRQWGVPRLIQALWPQSRILGALFKLLIHGLAGVVVQNLSV